MHLQFTHFISIYETIRNRYDGEKDYSKKKKKQLNTWVTLPTTEQSNSLTGQNTDATLLWGN